MASSLPPSHTATYGKDNCECVTLWLHKDDYEFIRLLNMGKGTLNSLGCALFTTLVAHLRAAKILAAFDPENIAKVNEILESMANAKPKKKK